jgi:uncharacterized protein (DUF849 family)
MKFQGVKPEIKAFDLSDVLQAVRLETMGILSGPLYVQFVMAVKDAKSADERVLDLYIDTLRNHRSKRDDAPRELDFSQIALNAWAIREAGHARTGLEDNARLDRDTLAPTNAALVRRVTALLRSKRPTRCELEGRSPDPRDWDSCGG